MTMILNQRKIKNLITVAVSCVKLFYWDGALNLLIFIDRILYFYFILLKLQIRMEENFDIIFRICTLYPFFHFMHLCDTLSLFISKQIKIQIFQAQIYTFEWMKQRPYIRKMCKMCMNNKLLHTISFHLLSFEDEINFS